MKKLYTLFVALLIANSALTQTDDPCESCLPQGITFSAQSQIDSFQIHYPNCTEIEGSVMIYGEDINNLNGLNVLTSIGGSLQIGWYVLNWTYYVCRGTSLYDLEGLNNLTSIGGRLIFLCNQNLENLSGLESLQSIGGGSTVGGELRFGGWSIDPLGSFVNPALSDLSALNNLTEVDGFVLVLGSNLLQSLNGLGNINANTITGLFLERNANLCNCEVQSVCDFLANPTNFLEIDNNAFGCASIEEVENACEMVSITESNLLQIVSVYPNPTQSIIAIDLSTQPPRNTSLTISNTNGQLLITQPITERKIEIDLTHLPAGIYIVKVWNDKEVMVQKIIKK